MPSVLRLLHLLSVAALVSSQPSPEQQKRITTAIRNAAHDPSPDYTAFVNPFIGTGKLLHLCFAKQVNETFFRQFWRRLVRELKNIAALSLR